MIDFEVASTMRFPILLTSPLVAVLLALPVVGQTATSQVPAQAARPRSDGGSNGSLLGQTARASSDGSKLSAAAAFEEGQNAQQRGDLNSAIRFYTSAIAADASLYQAYYQRGTALLSQGRESDALADLRKVIELEPKFARAHRTLGQIFLDRGKIEEA